MDTQQAIERYLQAGGKIDRRPWHERRIDPKMFDCAGAPVIRGRLRGKKQKRRKSSDYSLMQAIDN